MNSWILIHSMCFKAQFQTGRLWPAGRSCALTFDLVASGAGAQGPRVTAGVSRPQPGASSPHRSLAPGSGRRRPEAAVKADGTFEKYTVSEIAQKVAILMLISFPF